jgi:hypothetical protein
MVECSRCLGGWHLSCLDPPLEDVPQVCLSRDCPPAAHHTSGAGGWGLGSCDMVKVPKLSVSIPGAKFVNVHFSAGPCQDTELLCSLLNSLLSPLDFTRLVDLCSCCAAGCACRATGFVPTAPPARQCHPARPPARVKGSCSSRVWGWARWRRCGRSPTASCNAQCAGMPSPRRHTRGGRWGWLHQPAGLVLCFDCNSIQPACAHESLLVIP